MHCERSSRNLIASNQLKIDPPSSLPCVRRTTQEQGPRSPIDRLQRTSPPWRFSYAAPDQRPHVPSWCELWLVLAGALHA